MELEAINKLIFEIPVDLIDPNPLNPRKTLGDLKELMTSIKQSGIMQNLTVVETDAEPKRYTCLIGHRRLAAAKRVGLKTVPAAIVRNMEQKEQIATMVAENMQRNDLTITEQAGAIQLMLDFGDDFAEIADKTGLSESTVRRRAKLSQFDKTMLDKAVRRGASLLDIEKISKIKKDEQRERLLQAAGTADFKNLLKKYKDEQEEAEMLPKVLDALREKGFQIVENVPSGGTYTGGIYDIKKAFSQPVLADFQEFKKKHAPDAVWYALKTTYRNSVELWFTSETGNEKMRQKQEEQRIKERWRKEIESLHLRFQELWKEHYLSVYNGGRLAHPLGDNALVDYIALRMKGGLGYWLRDRYVKETKNKSAELEIYLISMMKVCGISEPVSYGRYDKNNITYQTNTLPLLLESGYEPSSEETAFYDGTHAIWKRSVEDED